MDRRITSGRTPGRDSLLRALFVVLLVAAAFGAGWRAGAERVRRRLAEEQEQERRLGGFTLINPLLDCGNEIDARLFRGLEPLQQRVEDLVQRKTGPYRLTQVSVYFRDLNNGPWFSINEKERFAPASLLKVPTMIACLKQAERAPRFLAKRLTYTGEQDHTARQNIKPPESMQPGIAYTIDDLLFRSIAWSDNNANELLFSAVDKDLLADTYRAAGVTPPTRFTPDDYLTVQSYASFFRMLFNATYLGRDMSHKALELLTHTDFKDGIVAGVPPDMLVAQKFGERIPSPASGIRQLHDCGIIYYPDHPYLLCIMSRGTDFSALDDIIRDVSRMVYEGIDGQHRQERRRGR